MLPALAQGYNGQHSNVLWACIWLWPCSAKVPCYIAPTRSTPSYTTLLTVERMFVCQRGATAITVIQYAQGYQSYLAPHKWGYHYQGLLFYSGSDPHFFPHRRWGIITNISLSILQVISNSISLAPPQILILYVSQTCIGFQLIYCIPSLHQLGFVQFHSYGPIRNW